MNKVENKVHVIINFFGTLQKENRSFSIQIPKDVSRRRAVDIVKQKLMDRGIKGPYQVFFNGKFASSISEEEFSLQSGDVFKIIPVMGGG